MVDCSLLALDYCVVEGRYTSYKWKDMGGNERESLEFNIKSWERIA